MNKNYLINAWYMKRDNLLEKLIGGAILLDELFMRIIDDSKTDPMEFGRDLAEKYDITINQLKNLEKITRIISKAKKVIEYIEKEFGLAKDGHILDSCKLYNQIFPDHIYPKGYFFARTFSFAVGFYLPENCFDLKEEEAYEKGPFLGLAYPNCSDCLEWTLDNCLKSLGNEPKNPYDLSFLGFKINYPEILKMEKDSSKEQDGKKTSENYTIERVVQHELKHIIDKFIGLGSLATQELSAEFFEGLFRPNPFERDLKKSFKRLERAVKDSNELEEKIRVSNPLSHISFFDSLIQKKKVVGERITDIKKLKELDPDVFKRIVDNHLSMAVLSYIIGTTDIKKLNNRLFRLSRYLKG
ncbi:hypothetical protein HYX16_02425 [Candidatus Woesearchaeota archaeon]|nr:hypothetical protein [Candidatus Woesearchaeota archaeon]